MIKSSFEYSDMSENQLNLLWLWKNQPPVMQWWFTLSGISILAVSFVLFIQI